MKDTKIKWIGDIPDDWDVIKVKYNCSLKGRIGWQGLTTDEYIDEGPFLITGTDFDDGVINWDSCVHVSEWRWEQAPEIQVREGDLLITKDGTVGKVAIVTDIQDKTTLNSGVMVIRPTEPSYETRFLYYVLKSEEFWKWFNYINSGSTTISHLYQHDLNHFYFAVSSLPEQRDIVAFLDRKCEQIDRVTQKVRKQLELLKNARKSLITECVKNGIRDNVEKKNTDISWIPTVPKHWEVKRIKYISSIISKGATPNDISPEQDDYYEYRFVKAENIQNNELQTEPKHFISEENYFELKRSILKENDLLIVIAGATTGKCAIVTKEFNYANINQAISFIRLEEQYYEYAKFFKYVLESQIKDEVIKGMIVQSAQPNLSMSNIANIHVPIPSCDEMIEIIKCLEKKCFIIDKIIEKKEKELETLEAHKTSIINEYITGKKRVNTAAKEV